MNPWNLCTCTGTYIIDWVGRRGPWRCGNLLEIMMIFFGSVPLWLDRLFREIPVHWKGRGKDASTYVSRKPHNFIHLSFLTDNAFGSMFVYFRTQKLQSYSSDRPGPPWTLLSACGFFRRVRARSCHRPTHFHSVVCCDLLGVTLTAHSLVVHYISARQPRGRSDCTY